MEESDDVLPDLEFAAFVEDFVAHAGVKFAGDVGVAALMEEIDGFREIFMTDETGVVGAGDEENGQVRVGDAPTGRAVGAGHELEKHGEAIEGEGETAAGVGVIGRDDGGIAHYPRIGAGVSAGGGRVAVLAGELGGGSVIAGEGEILDEIAAVAFAEEEPEEGDGEAAGAGAETFAG